MNTGFCFEADVFEYMKVNGEHYRNYKSFQQIDFGSLFNMKGYSAAAKITHTHTHTLIIKYE